MSARRAKPVRRRRGRWPSSTRRWRTSARRSRSRRWCRTSCSPSTRTARSVQPNATNLRYMKSGANGTWTNISASSGGGNGNVFASNANINQNDWALVPVTTSTIHAFRRKADGTGIDGATYNTAGNNWSPISVAPPAFGAGPGVQVRWRHLRRDRRHERLAVRDQHRHRKLDPLHPVHRDVVDGVGDGARQRHRLAGAQLHHRQPDDRQRSGRSRVDADQRLELRRLCDVVPHRDGSGSGHGVDYGARQRGNGCDDGERHCQRDRWQRHGCRRSVPARRDQPRS